MLYKRGESGEMLMFFILFGFMLIVGGGIVGGVYLFYGGELDYRQEQADVLSYKIEKCLVENAELDKSKFFEECGLEESFFDGEEYNLEISKGDENYIAKGSNFVSCDLAGAKENKHFARCSKRVFEVKGVEFEAIVMVNTHKGQEVVG